MTGTRDRVRVRFRSEVGLRAIVRARRGIRLGVRVLERRPGIVEDARRGGRRGGVGADIGLGRVEGRIGLTSMSMKGRVGSMSEVGA